MCNAECIDFVDRMLGPELVEGRRILEVGSYDMNGSVRPTLESRRPREYVGVDVVPGPGVDVVCAAEGLLDRFGPESFDIVVSTEMIEHVRDWRRVIRTLKGLCRPGGMVIVTTRSRGFPFHPAPHDFWRYEPEDMAAVFSDFEAVTIERDAESHPGVFVRARRPTRLVETDLRPIALYSIVNSRRCADVSDLDVAVHRARVRAAALSRAAKGRLAPARARGAALRRRLAERRGG
ncbi:MAG TPA: methyltransferase domain-containing protein [Acidimicrobiales bacterium]|nr:methyltransferase domain-containing protein [Acidimicrobiales bacterium]